MQDADVSSTHTRQGMLTRLGLAAGGLLGLGAAAAAGAHAAPAAPPRLVRHESLLLRGRNWRVQGPSAVPGALPDAAAALVPAGSLADAEGRELGRFRAAALPGTAAHFQLHTFELPGGTLLGAGGGSLREAVYAVVGGTGRYAGVSGSYVARQSPRESGGDGTAEFTFTLTIPEA
jgi:hypothetical protein